ncbi:MAG: phosphoribosylformylglycinamidine synthase, partial [Clostridia bacterium]|nr:phosphoribosylformylglycinamidine synthase [Clostridia bacterium]
MVYRVFVEKKKPLAQEARALMSDAVNLLGITALEDVRILNRYDVQDISDELFSCAVTNVFSEPQVDDVWEDPDLVGAAVFAVEYLPGQFDQRADSAAQCIQIISRAARPTVKTAKVYALYGKLSDEDVGKIKKYVINPIEAREASLEKPQTLKTDYEIPADVKILSGFCLLDDAGIDAFIKEYSLAMDADDLRFCRDYFIKESRDPTLTEIRVIDTYWSDHCRHTTFLTQIDGAEFEDALIEKTYKDYLDTRKRLGRDKKPVCLMDLATLAVRDLKKKGLLDKLDESEEINACTVKIDVTLDGKKEKWLLLFKNETHNHPTEIEPFGGAATCIGGAIRDPLSGRAYVYAAMRLTGAADPLTPIDKTIPGKLPQRKIVTSAAAGYSSYGNQ